MIVENLLILFYSAILIFMLRTFFMGSPSFAVPFLELLHQRTELLGIFTQPDKPSGRGLSLTPSIVKQQALLQKIPVYEPTSLRKDLSSWVALLKNLQLDLIIVVAYGKILPQEILEIPRYGCLNIHTSLLPKYRGAAPIQWALMNAEPITGVTLMQMDAGMDTGPILLQKDVPIELTDDISSLQSKLSQIGVALLTQALASFDKNMPLMPHPQPSQSVSYAPLLNKETGLIDFDMPARKVLGHIQGVTPWPGAQSILYPSSTLHMPHRDLSSINCVPVKLFTPSLSLLKKNNSIPGEIIVINKDGMHVSCLEGTICIGNIQLPGGKKQPPKELQNGFALVREGTLLKSYF